MRRADLAITPHGDRTPATRRDPHSLPLMGIGNSTGQEPMIAGSDVTLISLPLMGIGNLVQRHRGGRQRGHGLITPHGDRKLRPGRHDAPRDHSGLITPHGDRKLDMQPLPASHEPLITPHGDRKPVRQLRACRTAPSNRDSLPLMGIGNEIGIGPLRDALVSLPLMGIGNQIPIAPRRRRLGLITPHGDRKLGRHPAKAGHPELITPHGDRKLEPAEPNSARHLLAKLITPHGDRKPPISAGSDGSSVPLGDDHGRPRY